MRVMTYIQQQVEAFALPLECATIQAAHHSGCQQSRSNLLGTPRQIQQQIGLQSERGVFHRQVQQRQIAQLYNLATGIPPLPLPVLRADFKIKFATTQVERAIQLAHLVQQGLRRIQITTQRGLALAENSGLFVRHRLAGIP